MSTALLVSVLLLSVSSGADAHARWSCPAPRDPSTGIKTGPCGAQSGDFSGDMYEIQPGPMTLVFEESIAHAGAPFTISLSREGEDVYDVVLLAHIPHNDLNAPVYGVESTYTKTYITVEIPDVLCERCALQLLNPMTDKLAGNGMESCIYDPDCSNCNNGKNCFSNYHSCANVRINGTAVARNDYVAPAQSVDWPYAHLPTDEYFIGEVANYTADNLWLLDVPKQFTTPIGPCV